MTTRKSRTVASGEQRSLKDLAKDAEGKQPADQDPARRLGNFTGAGEAARKGGRTSGIVGQTKQRSKSQNKNQNKKK